ncbi:MAG: hypothetical protein AAGF85_03600 [Bacteroidota bacterium]
MKKYVLIGASLVCITGISLYFVLGGNAELIFLVEDQQEQVIYGELFQGRPSEPRLEALFIKARDRSKETGRNLMIVTYDQDSVPLKQFIGTLQGPRDTKGLDTLILPAGKYITIEIKSHNLVMPRPDEIREAAEDFALKQNLKIQTKLSYEGYEGDSAMVVWFRCE